MKGSSGNSDVPLVPGRRQPDATKESARERQKFPKKPFSKKEKNRDAIVASRAAVIKGL
jgi:hypothetical protein